MTCLVCVCAEVTEAELLDAIRSGARQASMLMARTGAGLTCGDCRPDLDELIEDEAATDVLVEKGDQA